MLRAAGELALAVALERRRIAKGSRKGVKRVDVETSQDPSLRQTIVVICVQRSARWLIARALPGPKVPSGDELQQKIRQAREQHGGDEAAMREAATRAVEEQRVGGLAWLLPFVLRAVAIAFVARRPIPFRHERQTLADMLAGTKIISGGAPRWRRRRRRGESS